MSTLPRSEVELHEHDSAAMLIALESDRAPTATGLPARPLWIVAGQLGVILTVILGFGVLESLDMIPPKLTALLLFCCVAGMIALGPVRLINKVIISAPLLAFVGWWMASFLWTNDAYGWWRDTQAMLPLVLGFAVFAGLLPSWAFRGALVAACYVAVGYTVVQLGINPGETMSNPDDVAGWRGGFIHKNAMAPFMLFAALTIGCFDRRSARRIFMLAVIAVLVVMSQSGTSIATGLTVLLVCVFLSRMATSDQATSAVLAVSATATAIVASVSMAVFLPDLLEFGGKDPTLTSRTEIWAGIWTAVGQQPWLGYGAGGVWINPNLDPARSILRDLGFTVFHSHNGYLELLLLLGVVGLALFVWLAVSTLRLGLAHLRGHPQMGVYALGFLMLVLLISITEVTTLGIWLATLGALNCHMLRTVDRTSLRTPTLGVLVTGALLLTLGAASIAALSRGNGNGPIDSMTIVPGPVPTPDEDERVERDGGIYLPRRAGIPSTTVRPGASMESGAVTGADATAERLDDIEGEPAESPEISGPAESGGSTRPDGRSGDGVGTIPDSVTPPTFPPGRPAEPLPPQPPPSPATPTPVTPTPVTPTVPPPTLPTTVAPTTPPTVAPMTPTTAVSDDTATDPVEEPPARSGNEGPREDPGRGPDGLGPPGLRDRPEHPGGRNRGEA